MSAEDRRKKQPINFNAKGYIRPDRSEPEEAAIIENCGEGTGDVSVYCSVAYGKT